MEDSITNSQGVYLLHFDPRYKHAGHYLGYADDIGRRVQEHQSNQSGCKLTSAAVQAGVKLVVARVWLGGDRNLERKLKGGPEPEKRTGSLSRLCPICKQLKKGNHNDEHINSTSAVTQPDPLNISL
jgi:predicted GIY-YIG superfamily endonuclease